MSRNTQIAAVVLILTLCCCLALLVFGLLIWSSMSNRAAPMPSAVASPTNVPSVPPVPTSTLHITPTEVKPLVPTPSPSATPMAEVTLQPLPRPGAQLPTTEERLLATELPQRDLRLLAERLKKSGPIPEIVRETPPTYEIGDESVFWVGNVDTLEQAQVTAVLRYVTAHLYVWVEKGVSYDQDGLARSAENFESQTYPTTRATFGSEWSPGVDNDPHLHILHSTGERMGNSVAGYHSSADEYSQLANPYSNEREMFYVAIDGMSPGTALYDGVLAHEFQHMIHWASDRNEATWVSEGCSELAAELNGYDPGGFEWLFLADPDVQLTTWPELGSSAPHYGNSYLFVAYFWERFGTEALKRVVAHPANGGAGFDAVLADYGLSFDGVFADWLIANYLDNVRTNIPVAEDHLTYPGRVVGPVSTDVEHRRYPAQRASTVHQYAADYVELEGKGDLAIEFRGDTRARLVPVDARSGQYAWWSNRGDDSDTTLTRAFDLRSVTQATLDVWMWYDIEEDWDYAYVEVSTSGGRTWELLSGAFTTTSNPNGNSFGPAYTGKSDGWIQETFDLSPYAGQEVLVRFEYITDDAVNHAGWLIDDVRIPELGYEDDFESGSEGWEGEGFVYSDNWVSQRYVVQLIALGQRAHVYRMSLDETQRGRMELRGLGEEIGSAVLVISALAPATTEVATYEYAIRSLDQ